MIYGANEIGLDVSSIQGLTERGLIFFLKSQNQIQAFKRYVAKCTEALCGNIIVVTDVVIDEFLNELNKGVTKFILVKDFQSSLGILRNVAGNPSILVEATKNCLITTWSTIKQLPEDRYVIYKRVANRFNSTELMTVVSNIEMVDTTGEQIKSVLNRQENISIEGSQSDLERVEQTPQQVNKNVELDAKMVGDIIKEQTLSANAEILKEILKLTKLVETSKIKEDNLNDRLKEAILLNEKLAVEVKEARDVINVGKLVENEETKDINTSANVKLNDNISKSIALNEKLIQEMSKAKQIVSDGINNNTVVESLIAKNAKLEEELKKFTDLNKELKYMQEKEQLLEQEDSTLKIQIVEIEQELQKAKASNLTLREENVTLKEKVTKKLQVSEKLIEELEALRYAVAVREQKIIEITKLVKSMSNKTGTVKQAIQNNVNNISEAWKSSEEVKGTLKVANKKLATETEKLQSENLKLTLLQNEQEKLNNELAKANENMLKLELTAVQFPENSEEMGKLSKEINALRDRLVTGESAIINKQTEISSLEESCTTYSSQIDDLTLQLNTRKDEVESLYKELGIKANTITELTLKVKQLTAKIDELKNSQQLEDECKKLHIIKNQYMEAVEMRELELVKMHEAMKLKEQLKEEQAQKKNIFPIITNDTLLGAQVVVNLREFGTELSFDEIICYLSANLRIALKDTGIIPFVVILDPLTDELRKKAYENAGYAINHMPELKGKVLATAIAVTDAKSNIEFRDYFNLQMQKVVVFVDRYHTSEPFVRRSETLNYSLTASTEYLEMAREFSKNSIQTFLADGELESDMHFELPKRYRAYTTSQRLNLFIQNKKFSAILSDVLTKIKNN